MSKPESASALNEAIETWPKATLEYKPNTGEITASNGKDKTSPLRGEAAQAFFAQLGEARGQTLKKKRTLKGVTVSVRRLGNQLDLAGVKG